MKVLFFDCQFFFTAAVDPAPLPGVEGGGRLGAIVAAVLGVIRSLLAVLARCCTG